MQLNADQIAEYERRADAGEKPVHPEWEITCSRPFFSVWSGVCLLNLSVYEVRDKRAPEEETHWMLWDELMRRDAAPFKSKEAAMLAAESLLRSATAPLHRDNSATFRKHLIPHLRLTLLGMSGKRNSEEADQLRDEMDGTYYDLTDEEHATLAEVCRIVGGMVRRDVALKAVEMAWTNGEDLSRGAWPDTMKEAESILARAEREVRE